MGLFDIFKKKEQSKSQNEIQRLIDKDGIDFVARRFAEIVNQKIASEDIAIQFLLEELEAASRGNAMAKEFVLHSGFDEDDYIGAMKNSFEEVDGGDGPQQLLLGLCTLLHPDMDLVAKFRIKVVDNIMKHWELGKYNYEEREISLWDVVEKRNHTPMGHFYDIYVDLQSYIDGVNPNDDDKLLHMSCMYAMKIAAAGLYLQGLFGDSEYQEVNKNFKYIQSITGNVSGMQVGLNFESVILDYDLMEKALDMAINFVKSYNDHIDKKLSVKIMKIVDNDEVECPKDNDEAYKFEQIMAMYK